jgi:flagellum-specific ATP synthase
MQLSLQKEIKLVKEWSGGRISGKVTHVIGMLIESIGPESYVGQICYIYGKNDKVIPCQVVGFKENKVLLMAIGEMSHIAPGSEVWPKDEVHTVPAGNALIGRVLDALGNPIDGKGKLKSCSYVPVTAPPPSPLLRDRIVNILPTGIKAIDALLTIGRGQRIGIFSGSGVGKSTLMGMIARHAVADVVVIALIGERGREVREFIERDLGEEGLKKAVVVVATSDQSAPLRSKGANVATSIAEYFRGQGKKVILMMDSITRYAMAQREMGLAIGEPPTAKGYPPSVFANLPCLLERAGNSDVGSITGFYTVLAEADDMNDPVADQVRSLLDGHIFLSRKLATAGHFPPIDVLSSLSRVMSSIVDENQLELSGKFRDLLQTYYEAEDLINIGAYVSGSNAKIDHALKKIGPILGFLKQKEQASFAFDEIKAELRKVLS